MAKPVPSVEQLMTASPHSIGSDQPLTLAQQMMRDHKVRHLPVLAGGVLVGMLSERDVALVMSMKEVDPARITVEDAMSAEVYSVRPDTPLDEVARAMADHRYGSAVVLANDRIAGVFTTVDASRALSELFHG